jgi:trans-aconitate 2-methyltransferase
MSRDVWDPAQYDRFRDERSKPFFDLVDLVRAKPPLREGRPAMRVVDLGCGTGELTQSLHRKLGAAETLGIDSSAAMLERAQALAGGGLAFERRDIADFAASTASGRFDLVFSNAALHWVPDHETLLARLRDALAPGGQLAVQVPANHDHPSQVVAAEVAGEEPFRDALRGFVRRSPLLAPEAYAVVLDALGYREPHVRLVVYSHHLPTRDDVVEWVKGSVLTDYQKRMPDELYPRFLDTYRERLGPRLADTRPYLLTYKRLFLWALR